MQILHSWDAVYALLIQMWIPFLTDESQYE
jgi:hypothetical protein